MEYPEIKTEEKEELLLGVVADTIMFERIYRIVDALTNAYDPASGGNSDALAEYYGLFNAYAILGYPHPKTLEEEEATFPITEKLHEIFYELFDKDADKKPEERENATKLAEKIIKEWKTLLN